MIHQLRVYEIFDENKDTFHARFRDHAARIMKRYGFDIVAMWEAKTPRRTEFVYLLRWPDEGAKNAAWAKFMADEEWKEIKRVTRRTATWSVRSRIASSFRPTTCCRRRAGNRTHERASADLAPGPQRDQDRHGHGRYIVQQRIREEVVCREGVTGEVADAQ